MVFCYGSLSKLRQVQGTLEQHGLELRRSTYTWIFFFNGKYYVTVPSEVGWCRPIDTEEPQLWRAGLQSTRGFSMVLHNLRLFGWTWQCRGTTDTEEPGIQTVKYKSYTSLWLWTVSAPIPHTVQASTVSTIRDVGLKSEHSFIFDSVIWIAGWRVFPQSQCHLILVNLLCPGEFPVCLRAGLSYDQCFEYYGKFSWKWHVKMWTPSPCWRYLFEWINLNCKKKKKKKQFFCSLVGRITAEVIKMIGMICYFSKIMSERNYWKRIKEGIIHYLIILEKWGKLRNYIWNTIFLNRFFLFLRKLCIFPPHCSFMLPFYSVEHWSSSGIMVGN